MVNENIHLAICTPFNDSYPRKADKRKLNYKGRTSYLEKFIALYYSVEDNWTIKHSWHVFHTIPFKSRTIKIMKKLGVKTYLRKDENHKYFNRPKIYIEPIECTHKLVVDCDMVALQDINFKIDQNIDAFGMAGGRNFSKRWYIKLCNSLNIKVPKENPLLKALGNNGHWRNTETYYYHFKNNKKRLFPYFNNGCILVKNSFSKKLGEAWVKNRLKAFKKGFVPNLGQAGELTIGLTINHLTDNWKILPRGFNIVVGPMTKRYINGEYKGPFYLVHLVSLSTKTNFYKRKVRKYLVKKDKLFKTL